MNFRHWKVFRAYFTLPVSCQIGEKWTSIAAHLEMISLVLWNELQFVVAHRFRYFWIILILSLDIDLIDWLLSSFASRVSHVAHNKSINLVVFFLWQTIPIRCHRFVASFNSARRLSRIVENRRICFIEEAKSARAAQWWNLTYVKLIGEQETIFSTIFEGQ